MGIMVNTTHFILIVITLCYCFLNYFKYYFTRKRNYFQQSFNVEAFKITFGFQNVQNLDYFNKYFNYFEFRNAQNLNFFNKYSNY